MANEHHCVQCGMEVNKGVMITRENGSFWLPVCHSMICPNYGLVQVGIENMDNYDQARNRNAGASKKKA
jgi:hypothetical protein